MGFLQGISTSVNGVFQYPAVWYAFLVWVLVWKGWALWRASQRKQPYWFIVMLVLNTAGILEILYLFVFSRMHWWKKGKKNERVIMDKKEKDKGEEA